MGVHNPAPSAKPILWGVLPRIGPKTGDTPVSFYGVNFDGSTTATLGTSQVESLNVVSATVLTGVSTAGAGSPNGGAGLRTVTVTTTQGSFARRNGWIYTPAVTASPTAYKGASYVMAHYGPPGASYSSWLSTQTTVAPLPEGTLLIGPNILINFIPIAPYGPSGVSTLVFDLPNDPILEGLTIYIQDLELLPAPPHQLTNVTKTRFF